jgi:hypothetical protein
MSQPRGRKADTIVRAIEAKILNGGVVAWCMDPRPTDIGCVLFVDDAADGAVTLTFLTRNIEDFQNTCYWISTTYEISSPIKNTQSANCRVNVTVPARELTGRPTFRLYGIAP